ncbi:TonB-dependent receptor domain-containing protein [Sphingomonas arenae]|uniref:TonB-dependent receptor domain-containing protein n=1 Tax=Sphingomonas arenae TaxID=2812555 RepID=UPI001F395A42|nr:TonB-dependent receptor [Sphingomonas arenae]
MSTVSLAALAFIAAPAAAQDAPATPDTPQAPDCPDQNDDGVCDPATTVSSADGSTAATESGAIVITGSRIRRNEFTTAEPITVVTKQEITQAGFNSATDALQSNAVTAGASQINNYYSGFVVDGGTGANTVGLRNLGPARTLVLLNGRRLSPAGTRGSVLAADLNVLPTSIVERIEVLKAGASSVYGSDAIAGVINIITDQKVRGLTLETQVNVPEIGAGVDRRIAGTFGFGTDRLNIIGSVEYRKRDGIRLNDVGFASCPIGGFLNGEGTPFGSGDGVGFDGTPCFTLDNGGTTINTLGVPTRQAIGRTSGVLGNFNRLVPDATVIGGPTPGFRGVGFYDRDTFDPDSQKEFVVSPVKTLTGFLSATYDLQALGGAELYGEVLATRRKSSAPLYRQLSLDYIQGSPLLPEIFRNGAFLAPNETSSGNIVAARAFIGFGLTDSRQQVDYVRAGGGIRGDFFLKDWRYDVYVGKSWTDARYEIESFLIDRLANSLLVTDNGDGTFSCANVASNPGCVAAPALSADVIGGNLPQAFKDYILENTIGTNIFRETTAIASIDGPIFRLPGGDAQLALGAEYRKQRIDDTPDENAINGNLLGLTSSEPTRGTDSVKEVFGEVFLPLLKDLPFARNLNLTASARWTDYKSYGSDTTYKLAGEWEPIRGLGFRGSIGTSYRAPALAEQFLGATSGFLPSGNDPCDADNFPRANGQPNPGAYSPRQQLIAANCASIGLDVGTFQQNSGVTTFTRGGAEFGLEAETSKNWSVGVVLQPVLPSSIGNLSLALDYFNIKVENGVSSLTAPTILGRCYADVAFDPTAGFCRFVDRDENNVLTVNSDYVNLSTDIVKGFEFNGRYSRDLFGGNLVINANVTKYTEQSTRLFPEEFLTDANGTYVTPDWVGAFDATYRRGRVTFRYGLDWIDGSEGTYDYFAFDEQTGEVDEALAQSYRDFYRLEVPNYFLHSASVQFNPMEKFELTVGVRNMFDRKPPRISAAVNTVGNAPLYSGYDYVGRSFFVNATVGF